MRIRFYVCPLAYEADTGQDFALGYYPKLHDYGVHERWSAILPQQLDGTFRFNKALVMVAANDHSVYQSDSTIIDIFRQLDFEGMPKSEIVNKLKNIRVSQVPVNIREKILGYLESVGISKEQVAAKISLSDSLLKVLRVAIEYFKDTRDLKTCDDEIERGYLGE